MHGLKTLKKINEERHYALHQKAANKKKVKGVLMYIGMYVGAIFVSTILMTVWFMVS